MTELFGRPIVGDITYTRNDVVEQEPDENWISALDALFELPEVGSVRWEQYTPYFNDGEPCEFTIHDVSLRLTELEDVDPDDAFGDYEDNYVGPWELSSYYKTRINEKVPGVDLSEEGEILKRFNRFNRATGGGAHYILLKKTFGDHAQITATREGFNVEYYEHE